MWNDCLYYAKLIPEWIAGKFELLSLMLQLFHAKTPIFSSRSRYFSAKHSIFKFLWLIHYNNLPRYQYSKLYGIFQMKCEFQASFYESNIFSRFAVNIFTAGNKKKTFSYADVGDCICSNKIGYPLDVCKLKFISVSMSRIGVRKYIKRRRRKDLDSYEKPYGTFSSKCLHGKNERQICRSSSTHI